MVGQDRFMDFCTIIAKGILKSSRSWLKELDLAGIITWITVTDLGSHAGLFSRKYS